MRSRGRRSRRRHRRSRRRKNQLRGGMSVLFAPSPDDMSPEDRFLAFLSPADGEIHLQFVYSGTYGHTIQVTSTSRNSPYRLMTRGQFGEPVTQLIVKFQIIVPGGVTSFPTLYSSLDPTAPYAPEIAPSRANDFFNEVQVQTNVARDTMSYLQPLCPMIVYADILPLNHPLLAHLIGLDRRITKDKDKNVNAHKFIHDRQWWNVLGQEHNSENIPFQLSVIAMEIAAGYTPAYFMPETISMVTRRAYVIWAVIQLAVQTGYHHGDFHDNNVMVKVPTTPDEPFRFTETVLLIDFGMTRRIPLHQRRHIRTLYEQEQYMDIVKLLCSLHNAADFTMNSYPRHYPVCFLEQKDDIDAITNQLKWWRRKEPHYLKTHAAEFNQLPEDTRMGLTLPLPTPLPSAIQHKLFSLSEHSKPKYRLAPPPMSPPRSLAPSLPPFPSPSSRPLLRRRSLRHSSRPPVTSPSHPVTSPSHPVTSPPPPPSSSITSHSSRPPLAASMSRASRPSRVSRSSRPSRVSRSSRPPPPPPPPPPPRLSLPPQSLSRKPA